MERGLIFLGVILFGLFYSQCDKESPSGVETFIESIQENRYEENSIPNFYYQDLGRILSRNLNFDEKFRKYYLLQSLSSSHALMLDDFPSTGEVLLMCVELNRIRSLGEFEKDQLFLEPKIKKRIPNEPYREFLNSEELKEVWQLYKDWWEQSDSLLWSELRQIDPLEGSAYFWG